MTGDAPGALLHRRSKLFKALSDPTRLRILRLLRGGELCVCDIVGNLEVPQAKTSRHLAYLRKVGLVKVRKTGLWSFYSISPPGDLFHQRLLECLGASAAEEPRRSEDARRADRVRKRSFRGGEGSV
jgi:ArsR family transcriptional regulator